MLLQTVQWYRLDVSPTKHHPCRAAAVSLSFSPAGTRHQKRRQEGFLLYPWSHLWTWCSTGIKEDSRKRFTWGTLTFVWYFLYDGRCRRNRGWSIPKTSSTNYMHSIHEGSEWCSTGYSSNDKNCLRQADAHLSCQRSIGGIEVLTEKLSKVICEWLQDQNEIQKVT